MTSIQKNSGRVVTWYGSTAMRATHAKRSGTCQYGHRGTYTLLPPQDGLSTSSHAVPAALQGMLYLGYLTPIWSLSDKEGLHLNTYSTSQCAVA